MKTTSKTTIRTVLLSLSLALLSLTSFAGAPLDTLIARYDQQGNPEGKYLFPKAEDSNLRILDCNIWEWDGSKDKLPPAWVEAGEDCTNEHRNKGFMGLYLAYMPEVICLQEYSMPMHGHMYPTLKESGYEMTFIPDSLNYTPIY